MLHSELIRARDKKSNRLMVMLHGLGDSIEGYRWMPEALELPWLNYLLVNAPDEYYGGFSWFDINDIVPGVRQSQKLLFELLDSLPARGFEPGQMTLGGFSQGCLMAIDVGLRYPRRFAGIVGISGWICQLEQLVKEFPPVARQQRLLMTHGSRDPLVPFDQVRAQIPLLKAAGIDVQWREFDKVHTIIEDELAVIRDFVRAGYGE